MRSFVRAALEGSEGDQDSAGLAEPIEVVEASSGFEALRLLPRGPYDCVVTDVNMPDINGLELVRFIRDSDKHKECALVIISTDSRSVDRERGLKLGANDYLVKPFSAEELLAVTRRVLKT